VQDSKKGIIALGNIFSALDYDLDIYLSDTDGVLGSASGDSSETKIMGQVVGVTGPTTEVLDKALALDL